MHARSALFDLYGDHLRHRGHQAPVSCVLRLLEPVGIKGPAARTAISRMVGQGWLEPVVLPAGPGYRATESAIRRFDATTSRIYATSPRPWDGTWHLLLVEAPADRTRRERLRADLGFLGYAPVAGGWISPYPRPEHAEVLTRSGAVHHTARLSDLDPVPLDAWDLDRLSRSYAAWPARADAILDEELHRSDHGSTDPDLRAFTARFRLVHEWRKFLFDDPGLPTELLPADWPGFAAVRHFTDTATALKPAAERFLESLPD